MNNLNMILSLTNKELKITVIDSNQLYHHTLGNFWTTAEQAKTKEGVRDLFQVVADRVHDFLNKDKSNG